MIQHHNWSLEDIENMLPWERGIYIRQLKAWIEEENLRLKTIQGK